MSQRLNVSNYEVKVNFPIALTVILQEKHLVTLPFLKHFIE